MRDQRAQRQDDFRRNRDRRVSDRAGWFQNRRVNPFQRNISAIRSADRWAPRYDRWWANCLRPRYVQFVHIHWYEPMPVYVDAGMSYFDMQRVAENLEYTARDIYQTLDAVAPTETEYGQRLRRVLAQLIDATENYDDALDSADDISATLYDLFYLEDTVSLTEKTLDGYSQSYRVQEEMQAMRYYVNELLWNYRQQY